MKFDLKNPTLFFEMRDFYSIIENLVLWARSEITGFAMNECPGIMEYWNTEILVLAE